jgi:hypothetical protein
MNRALTIFGSGDVTGVPFARELAAGAERLGCRVAIEDDYAGWGSLRSCFCYIAVVHDLPGISEGSRRVPSKAYRVLSALDAGLQHVLVVSCQYLPLNVASLRRGSAPAYSFAATAVPGSRPAEPVADRGPWDREQGWIGAQAPADQVFISYRGNHHAEVESLASDVGAGRLPSVQGRPVRIVCPGELAMERGLLSAGRRWMVLGLLQGMLRVSAELLPALVLGRHLAGPGCVRPWRRLLARRDHLADCTGDHDPDPRFRRGRRRPEERPGHCARRDIDADNRVQLPVCTASYPHGRVDRQRPAAVPDLPRGRQLKRCWTREGLEAQHEREGR